MEKNSIFQFKTYKTWLASLFTHPDNRGLMSRVCRDIECQRSYMSRVLNSKLQLTPDYAFKVSESLRLSAPEQEYFLLLVDIDRCTDLQYKAFLNKKLKKLLSEQTELRDKVQRPSPSQSIDIAAYFSTWYFAAIHLWCATTGSHSVQSISKKFSLAESSVEKCLEALVENGFVERKSDRYSYKSGSMHLDRKSPFAVFNHSNWRQKAIQDAQLLHETSLHFTNLQTMTRSDYLRIRAIILEMIEKTDRIAKPSAPEELVLICVDAFLVE